MRKSSVVIAAAVAAGLGLSSLDVSAATVGVKFRGRVDTNSPNATPASAVTGPAGVVPQTNWNNVLNGLNTGGGFVNDDGTTGALVDSSNVPTTMTLTFVSNDSWHSDGAATSENEKLTDGILKAQGDNVSATLTFNNVPAGVYNLIVYTLENGTGAQGNFTVGATTYYTIEDNAYTDAEGFVRAVNTNPVGTRDTGNYVQFDNVVPVGNAITLTALHVTGTDGIGIAGLQLVSVPEPVGLGLLGIACFGLLGRRREVNPRP